MRGDIWLYKEKGFWPDMINRFTNGPYNHCAVDIGGGYIIGALNRGIVKVHDSPGVNITVVPIGGKNTDAGIAWLEYKVQQHLPYGWNDILSSGLKFLGIPFYIGQVGRYDCSDLAARYLIIAGASQPLGLLADDPQMISPNDIARAYGVL